MGESGFRAEVDADPELCVNLSACLSAQVQSLVPVSFVPQWIIGMCLAFEPYYTVVVIYCSTVFIILTSTLDTIVLQICSGFMCLFLCYLSWHLTVHLSCVIAAAF